MSAWAGSHGAPRVPRQPEAHGDIRGPGAENEVDWYADASLGHAEPGSAAHPAYVMASRFILRSKGDVPRFFWKSMKAWRQVRSAPGAFGASLVAQPLAGVFLTLSAWENRDALYTFAETEPHRSIMDAIRPTMRSATNHLLGGLHRRPPAHLGRRPPTSRRTGRSRHLPGSGRRRWLTATRTTNTAEGPRFQLSAK